MDTPVALGPQGGFPVASGGAYRLTCWISGNAFGLFPWDAPGRNDIVAAVKSAGGWQGDPHVYLQLDKDKPADWPDETGVIIPGDAFIVRAEGIWIGPGQTLAAGLTIPGQDEPLHVARVWQRAASTPAPGPSPSPGPAPGRPGPPSPGGPRPPPSPPSQPKGAGGDEGEDDGPRARPRGGGARVALGGAALFGLAALFARSRARRARSQPSERRT